MLLMEAADRPPAGRIRWNSCGKFSDPVPEAEDSGLPHSNGGQVGDGKFRFSYLFDPRNIMNPGKISSIRQRANSAAQAVDQPVELFE